MSKKNQAQSANANNQVNNQANQQANEMDNLLAIGAITSAEYNEAQAEAQAQAQAEAQAEAEAQKVVKNTTLNQLLERAKQVRKDVNSLNGVLKALYKEDIFKNLFDALNLKTYDEVRLSVIKAIAYCSEDVNGNFIAVTLKPIISTDKANIYKVCKLDWYTAVSQATYRLSKGLARVQELTIDSYYLPTSYKGIFDEITDDKVVSEIDTAIKKQKYNKAIERANKLKLEF